MSYAENFVVPSQSGDSRTKEGESGTKSIDDQYFDSYDLTVHRVMLADEPRMTFYRQYLLGDEEEADSAVTGRVVVDLGAGTGVLSMWAAMGGASAVIAVEGSPLASGVLQEVIRDNGLESSISVLPIRMEDCRTAEEFLARAQLSPNHREQLAAASEIILVSEWMGFYLLHEGMLNSVLYARDLLQTLPRRPRVTLFPDKARIIAAPVSLGPLKEKQFTSFWRQAGGSRSGTTETATATGPQRTSTQRVARGGRRDSIDFDRLADMEWARYLESAGNPLVEVLPPSSLLAEPQVLIELDLQTVRASDLLNIEAKAVFQFQALRGESTGTPVEGKGSDPLNGFSVWFDVSGSSSANQGDQGKGDRLVLPTGPRDTPTHWKQTTVLLPEGIPLTDIVSEGGPQEVPMGVIFRFTANNETYSNRIYSIDIELFDPNEQ